MNSSIYSLRTANELIRAGQLADAAVHVVQLKEARPELADFYESKLAEIQRLKRKAGLSDKAVLPGQRVAAPEGRLTLDNLVVITASCHANEAKRRAIEATWGETLKRHGVRHFFVVGAPELERTYRLGQVLYVPCRDDYESLLLKLALAYEYLLATECYFTHVFKIDDDCYLNLPRFEADLREAQVSCDYIAAAVQPKEERISRRWHFGKCSDPRFDKEYVSDYPPCSYAKGGYGYLLSRKAAGIVVSQIPVFRKELEEFTYAYEDLRIGQILTNHGVPLDRLPTYSVAPPSSVSAVNHSVVYDITDVARFHKFHQELAVSLLNQGNASEFSQIAYAQGNGGGDTLGFDHVYLVNLRSAVDRRVSVQWALNRERICYELFSAFDGQSALGQGVLKAVMDRPVGDLRRHSQFSELEKWRGRKFIDSAGAVGYILTYVRILLDAKCRGFQRILILEDDVLLRHDFRAHLARFLSIVGPDYKVLQLGASQYGWQSVDLDRAQKEGRYRPRSLDTCGSFAMAVNTSIADELIEGLLSFDAPFDHLPLGQIYERYPEGCHVAYPNIVIPDVSESYIRGGRDQHSHAVKMRWPLEHFDYPRQRIRIGVVLRQGAQLRSAPPADLGVDLICYRMTVDGLRPLHDVSSGPAEHETLTPEQEAGWLDRPYVLPVDALFATQRSCDGAEVVLEALEAQFRFGAVDRRSREWLRPLQNQQRPSKPGLAAVIIPTRGRTDALVVAIKSVLEQDYPSKEVIVVDENEAGSTTAKFVHDHIAALKKAGAPIRLITHTCPRNAAAARNTGLFATQAQFVSFLDDDDAYLPGRLSKVIAVLKDSSPKTGGAYCGFLGWNSKTNDPARYPVDEIPRRLLNLEFRTHYVCTDTVTYRREALLSVNGYDESFRRHQDLELNIRIFDSWEIASVPEVLVQLNPLPPDNSSKLYDVNFFNVKMRFLEKFDEQISKLSLDRTAIFAAHVREMVNFTKNGDAVYEFALSHPSRFSSAYIAAVKIDK